MLLRVYCSSSYDLLFRCIIMDSTMAGYLCFARQVPDPTLLPCMNDFCFCEDTSRYLYSVEPLLRGKRKGLPMSLWLLSYY